MNLEGCASEVTIIIKGEDDTYRKKFLCYDPIVLSPSDETLQEYVKQALFECKKSGDDGVDITVRISIAWL